MARESGPIIIVGAGDHGRVVLELLRAAGEEVAGFVEPERHGTQTRRIVDGSPVLGEIDLPLEWLARNQRYVVALGDNRRRQAVFERCVELGLTPASAVHPSATILTGARIEPGAVICAGAIIGLVAWVGPNSIVNTAASVDHDCRIGPHATVAPGVHLAGRVTVAEGAFVGIGASVREGRTIGSCCLVGGGAMVTGDISPGSRVAGVPATPMDTERA